MSEIAFLPNRTLPVRSSPPPDPIGRTGEAMNFVALRMLTGDRAKYVA